jgi:hypothetical protein
MFSLSYKALGFSPELITNGYTCYPYLSAAACWIDALFQYGKIPIYTDREVIHSSVVSVRFTQFVFMLLLVSEV